MPFIRPNHLSSSPAIYLLPIARDNMKTHLGAHIARESSSHVHFDTNEVEIILDTRCSFTINSVMKALLVSDLVADT